jgi:hypothetical protein
MKTTNKLLGLIISATLFTACGGEQTATETSTNETTTELLYFGDTINTEGAIAVNQLPMLISGKDSIQVKLEGNIKEVCQVKGCWMMVGVNDDVDMRVRFKDYGFFMPKDAAGTTVIMEGMAYTDTTSVDELKHYAQDAGKSEEEINAITEPEVSLSFEAFGVIIKNEK